jgi:cell division septation protein DedD
MKRITPLILFVLALGLALAVVPGALASDGPHGSIAGRVMTGNNLTYSDISVVLVNATNTSQVFSNLTSKVDSNGFFQLTNVPFGDYKAMAQGPFLASGMSNHVNVTEAVTYWCAVALTTAPYYSNTTVTKNPIPLEGATTEIIVTVYDYWKNPVGAGLFVELTTTAGTLKPYWGTTDEKSQFHSILTSPDNGSYAEIQPYSMFDNATYYPLQKIDSSGQVLPAPSPMPSPTAIPSVTPTPVPSPTAEPTAAPNATATPTSTPKPTPGFEIAFALASLGIVAFACKKFK